MQSQTPNLYIHVPLMYTDVSISQIRSQQGLKIPARERKLSFFFFHSFPKQNPERSKICTKGSKTTSRVCKDDRRL